MRGIIVALLNREANKHNELPPLVSGLGRDSLSFSFRYQWAFSSSLSLP